MEPVQQATCKALRDYGKGTIGHHCTTLALDLIQRIPWMQATPSSTSRTRCSGSLLAWECVITRPRGHDHVALAFLLNFVWILNSKRVFVLGLLSWH